MWLKMLQTVPCRYGLYIIGQAYDLPRHTIRVLPKKSWIRCGLQQQAADLQKVAEIMTEHEQTKPEQSKKAIEQSPKDKQLVPDKSKTK